MTQKYDHVAPPFGQIQVGSTWFWQGEGYQVQGRVRWRERWQPLDAFRESHGVWVYDEWQLESESGQQLRLIEDRAGVREVLARPEPLPDDVPPAPPFDAAHAVQSPQVAGNAEVVFAENIPEPIARSYFRYRFQGRDHEAIREGNHWQIRQLTPVPQFAVQAALATNAAAWQQANSRKWQLMVAVGSWSALVALGLWYALAYPGELVVQQWWTVSPADSRATWHLTTPPLRAGEGYRLELRAPDLHSGQHLTWAWRRDSAPGSAVIWQDSLLDQRGQDRQGAWRELRVVASRHFHLTASGPFPGNLQVMRPPAQPLRVRVSLWRGGWSSQVWVLLLLLGFAVMWWISRRAPERLPGGSWSDRRWRLTVAGILLLSLGVGYFLSSNGWGFDGLLDSPVQASEMPSHRE